MHEHLKDVKEGRTRVMQLKDISEKMHINERHLSNVVKEVTGKSPCHLFEPALLEVVKELLSDHKPSEVAAMMDYDPSNFTKFFKRYSGQTPSQYKHSV